MTSESKDLESLNAELKEAKDLNASLIEETSLNPEWWSATNAMTVSSVVLVFGLLIMILATYLIKIGTSTDSVLKIFGTILIIISSIFLVVAGYGDNQIAPVMGLLGTIAGYLLGKDTKTKE
jgi:hypothetical protein